MTDDGSPAGRRRPPSRPPRWVMDVVTGALILTIGLAPEPQTATDSMTGYLIRTATLLLLVCLLPLRRPYPLPMLAVGAVGVLASPIWTGTSGGYFLVLAVAVYRVAYELRPRTAVVSSGITAAVLLAAVALSNSPGPHYSRFFQPVAVIGVALAAGEAARNRRADVAAIVERAERAERTRAIEVQRQVAEERLRIARDLHDGAAHQIAAINLHAGVASNALPDRPEDAERSLVVIRDAAHSVLDEISALLRVLREEPGLAAEPVATMEGLAALIDEFDRTGLHVALDVRGRAEDIDGAAGVVAYRAVQEGLANALKHGDGRADVRIDVRADEALIRVSNPVPAGRAADALRSGRHGLLGVRERVDSVHGRMRAGREQDRYVLQVELPLSVGARR